jgi:hypothetical protein
MTSPISPPWFIKVSGVKPAGSGAETVSKPCPSKSPANSSFEEMVWSTDTTQRPSEVGEAYDYVYVIRQANLRIH